LLLYHEHIIRASTPLIPHVETPLAPRAPVVLRRSVLPPRVDGIGAEGVPERGAELGHPRGEPDVAVVAPPGFSAEILVGEEHGRPSRPRGACRSRDARGAPRASSTTRSRRGASLSSRTPRSSRRREPARTRGRGDTASRGGRSGWATSRGA